MTDHLTRTAMLALCLGMSWSAGSAAAQDCQADSDCSPGYICETYSAGWCSAGPCEPGGSCPEPVCEEYEYSQCTPAPCSSDTDCGGDMVCYTRTGMACPDSPGCAPDMDCPDANAGTDECTTYTESRCAHRYELPCEADADCGPGFRCRENEYWICEDKARDPDAVDGGAEEGSCYPVQGDNSCELLELPCETSADCFEGFECVEQPRWDCGGGNGDGDGDGDTEMPPQPAPTEPAPLPGADGDGASDPVVPVDDDQDPAPGAAVDGGVGVPCAPAEPSPKVCMPSSWGGGGSGGEPGSGGNGGDPAGDGDGDSDGGEDSSGGEPPPDDGSSGPQAPGGDGDSEGDHDRGGRWLGQLLRNLLGKGKGCSVSDTSDASAMDLSWLAVLGIVAGAARRRRSRL